MTGTWARAAAITFVALAAAGCGGGSMKADVRPAPWLDPDGDEPIVGSLAVDPGDASLWLATNRGLYRVRKGRGPQRVTGVLQTPAGGGRISGQLVVGFTGPGEMVASGHPSGGSSLPPALGLIRSIDGAASWTSVSELGAADFHTLEHARGQLVGVLYGESQILVSSDGGRTWRTRAAPDVLVDLAVDPAAPARWAATTRDALYVTDDAGRTWRPAVQAPNARLAWPASDRLYRVDPGGEVLSSPDGGRDWHPVGGEGTGEEPRALTAHGPELYAALLDGTVTMSGDGGRSWRTLVDGR